MADLEQLLKRAEDERLAHEKRVDELDRVIEALGIVKEYVERLKAKRKPPEPRPRTEEPAPAARTAAALTIDGGEQPDPKVIPLGVVSAVKELIKDGEPHTLTEIREYLDQRGVIYSKGNLTYYTTQAGGRKVGLGVYQLPEAKQEGAE